VRSGFRCPCCSKDVAIRVILTEFKLLISQAYVRTRHEWNMLNPYHDDPARRRLNALKRETASWTLAFTCAPPHGRRCFIHSGDRRRYSLRCTCIQPSSLAAKRAKEGSNCITTPLIHNAHTFYTVPCSVRICRQPRCHLPIATAGTRCRCCEYSAILESYR
jgi:hypothetical protein